MYSFEGKRFVLVDHGVAVIYTYSNNSFLARADDPSTVYKDLLLDLAKLGVGDQCADKDSQGRFTTAIWVRVD